MLNLLRLILIVAVGGCSREEGAPYFTGYLESDCLYVSSPLPGYVQTLNVKTGQSVSSGTVLFRLESEPASYRVDQLKHQEAALTSELEDLQRGLRESEIEAIQARLDQARISSRLAGLEFERVKNLEGAEVSSVDELDRARARMELGAAQIKELNATLVTAGLGARQELVSRAEADLRAKQAELEMAQWQLEHKTGLAAFDGIVNDTFYLPGEWVKAGEPVVSLLLPNRTKGRFFVPESTVDSLFLGQTVFVRLEEAFETIPAAISYISQEAQFTPPVIFSRYSRSKLVYLVEAQFDPLVGAALHPGQPIEVFLKTP